MFYELIDPPCEICRVRAMMLNWEISKTVVSENGTEFTSMAIQKWVQDAGIDWPRKAPTKYPTHFLRETRELAPPQISYVNAVAADF